MKILIVDDEVTVLKTLGFFLEKKGHQVFLASDCHKALTMIEGEDIELVISDILLPDMSGLELLSLLKSFDKKDIPIIIISSLKESEIIRRTKELGAMTFFPKPINRQKFSLAIDNLSKVKLSTSK